MPPLWAQFLNIKNEGMGFSASRHIRPSKSALSDLGAVDRQVVEQWNKLAEMQQTQIEILEQHIPGGAYQ